MSDHDLAQRAAPDAGAWRTPWWGLGDFAIGFLLAMVGSQVTVTLALVGADVDEIDDLSLAWSNVAQLGLWLPMAGVTLWAAWLKGNGAVRDFGLRFRGIDVPLGVGTGLAAQLFVLPLVYIPILLLLDRDASELDDAAREITDRATDGFGVAMLVVLVVIGAPIVEELFYRGLLLRSLERRFGSTPAIVGSGLVFGLIHLNNPIGMPGLALFGMFLGYLAVRTGRLGGPIVAHMAFNAVAVVSLLAES